MATPSDGGYDSPTTVLLQCKSEIKSPSHGFVTRLPGLPNSATSGRLGAEVVFTSANPRRTSEVDATAVTKQIAELASVAIPSRSPLRFGQIAVVGAFDSRDPIAPGVDPAATRLRTAMMNG